MKRTEMKKMKQKTQTKKMKQRKHTKKMKKMEKMEKIQRKVEEEFEDIFYTLLVLALRGNADSSAHRQDLCAQA